MSPQTPPPRGLRWADTPFARAATTGVAFIAIAASTLIGIRQQTYITCVANQQRASAERAVALATATDAERLADTAVVAGPRPGGPTADELRAASVAARNVTDRVRAANPPAPARTC